MKTRRNNLVTILNIIETVLFLLPVSILNLFTENYSTLSLTTRGYLYVLFLGISIGFLLAYETMKISNNSVYSLVIFMSLLLGTCIPHQVPYRIQGNIHLIFAYIGFAGLVTITVLNCKIKKYRDIYLLFIFISILIYLKYGMVNTLSEIIVMLSTLFINYYLYIKDKF